MISYDQYENKIKKYAKFRNFMNRFKFLFIAIFALIIAAIATLLALKGSFSGEIKIASSIYGERYSDPEGVSAFLSSVSYEYAREGSDEWSSQKPVKAGKYSVRAVANKTVGKGYGKATTFEIAPREVTFSILSDSVEYGSVPNQISLDLLAGDTLDKDALLFKYDNYAASNTAVDLDESSVIITNGTDDRSSCYTVRHEKKELDITQRSIDVSLKQYGFVYSGSAISYSATASAQTEARLANGDVIRFGSVQLSKDGAVIDSAVSAGYYSALAQDIRIYKVIDGKEVEVTHQYKTVLDSVSFAIEKRPITVQTASDEKVYDGTPLQKSGGYKATGLVDGDTFIGKESISITSAQSVDNEIRSYEIKDSAGIDTSANYDISWEYGKLTVKPRTLRVITDSAKKIYDGNALSNHNYVDTYYADANGNRLGDGLLGGDVLLKKDGYSITNVKDSGDNQCTFSVPNENYTIIGYDCGTLTIVPREITLKTNSNSFVFNGTFQSEVGCTVWDYESGLEITVRDGSLKPQKIAQFKNVWDTEGATENNVCTYSVSDNYVIKGIKYGTITILPRELSVTTNSNTYVYDGAAHSDGGYTTSHNGEAGLMGADRLTLIGSAPSFTEVLETKGIKGNNVCTYSVPNRNYTLDEKNYVYGTITIAPRLIRVVTASATKVYDGIALSNDNYDKTYYIDDENKEQAGLLNGAELTLNEGYSITNVIESGNNTCTFTVPNENYVIIGYDYGKLTVTPRTLRVKTASAEKVYDGIALSNHNYVDTYYADANGNRLGDGLLGDEILVKKDDYAITDVRDSGDNQCTFSVPNENYSIIGYDYGTLTITKKDVSVQVRDVEATYGENYKIYPNEAGNFANPESCGFVGSDTVTLTVEFDLSSFEFKGDDKTLYDMGRLPVRWDGDAVGGYTGAVKKVDAYFSGSDIQNYNIQYTDGTLFITPRILTIVMKSVDTFYGEDLYNADGSSAVYPQGVGNAADVLWHSNIVGVGLLEGDTLEIKKIRYFDNLDDVRKEDDVSEHFATPKNQGVYGIKPYEIWIYPVAGKTEKTTDEEDDNSKGNYSVQFYTIGELTVKPRPIVVTLNDIAKEYYDGGIRLYQSDGETIVRGTVGASDSAYLKKPDALVYGEKLNVSVIFDKLPKYAGKYIYTFDKQNSTIEVDGVAVEGGLGNYSVSCKEGSFEISKRPVTLKMRNLALVYGESKQYPSVENCDVTSALKIVEGDYISVYPAVDFGCGAKPSVGTYTIKGSGAVMNNDSDDGTGEYNVNNSYEIVYDTGTLTVSPKDVNIKLVNMDVEYGEAFVDRLRQYLAENNSELAYGETLNFDLKYFQNGATVQPRNVGLYDVQFTPIHSAGEAGLNNYRFDFYKYLYTSGEGEEQYDKIAEDTKNATLSAGLRIRKLPITVSVVAPKSVVYGVPLGGSSYEVSPEIPYKDEHLTVDAYCEKNGEKITPKYAGTYHIVMGELLINGSTEGLDNYIVTRIDDSKKNTVTIMQRPISVVLDSLTVKYGNPVQYESGTEGKHYTITKGNLVYGDELFIFPNFGFLGTRPAVGSYTVKWNGDERKVLNGGEATDGDYWIADSYSITIETGLQLTIAPREIQLILNEILSEPIYYDGEAHNYVAGGEIIGGDGMADGEEIVVAVKYFLGENQADAIAKAGSYTYQFDKTNSFVLYGGTKMGLGNYTFTAGVLSRECEILKREIKVTLEVIDKDKKLTYGDNISYPEDVENYADIVGISPENNYGLVAGEKLKIAVDIYQVETGIIVGKGILPAGDYYILGNSAKSVVSGGTYADIGNYTVKFVNSAFKVEHRAVSVKLSDITADYGETPAYPTGADNYDAVEGLADGETLSIKSVEYLNGSNRVGKYEGAVHLIGVAIMRGSKDVTKNYTVQSVNGDLTIGKRKIFVTTATTTFVYDGIAHEDGRYTIEYAFDKTKGLAYDDVSALSADYVGEGKLPSVTEFLDSGKQNFFNIVIKNGKEDVSDNYIVEYTYGKLSVSKRKLYITTKSEAKMYDGEPLTSSETVDECYSIIDGKQVEGLVAGHQFKFTQKSITDVSEIENNCIDDILDADGVVSKMDNYQFEKKTIGKLTVYKRKIYVDASNYPFVYDGNAHTPSPDAVYTLTLYDEQKNQFLPDENVLVKGHTFHMKTPTLTDVGSIDNNPYEYVEQDGKKSGNYEIIPHSGKLEVTKRPVKVSIDDIIMTYCNAAPSDPDYVVEQQNDTLKQGVLRSDEWEFTYGITYKNLNNTPVRRFNAGSYLIELTYTNKEGRDNYNFYGVGNLTIEQAKLKLRPADKRELYESADQEITIAPSDLIYEGLVSGDSITNFAYNRTSLKASENKTSATVKILKDSVKIMSGSQSVKDNYEITLQTGMLSFIQRTLYYEQIIPEKIEKDPTTGRGLLPYTGDRHYIEGGDNLFYVLTADDVEFRSSDYVGISSSLNLAQYGLLDSDKAELKSAYVPKTVQVNNQWVRLNVVNKHTGNMATKLYKLSPVKSVARGDSSIEVLAVPVSVTFGSALTMDYIDTLDEGITLLGSEYLAKVSCEAGFLNDAGHTLEAAVYKKDGAVSIYIFIYEPRYDESGKIKTRVDRISLYRITAYFESGIESEINNVKLVTSSLYPTNGQGE